MLSLFSFYLIVAVDPKAIKDSLSSGAIAGIVIAVILIVLVAIDLFCCFFNSCGLFFCCSQALCGGGSGAKKEDCKYYAGMRSSHLAWSFLVARVSNFVSALDPLLSAMVAKIPIEIIMVSAPWWNLFDAFFLTIVKGSK